MINAGVGGYNSWESLINLQFRVLDIEPDLIIVYHGTNDVHARLVSPGTYKSDNSGRRKQWTPSRIPPFERSVLLRILSRNVGWTKQVNLGIFVSSPSFLGAGGGGKWSNIRSHATEILKGNPPTYFRRNLINMVHVARAHGVSVAFASWAHSPHFGDYASTDAYQVGFKESNDILKEVAATHGAHLFDFAAVMPNDKRYWADGRHVNEEGALMKARLFAEFLHGSGLLDSSP